MLAQHISYLIALIVLIIGSYTDFKTREVPDWINYGLIIIGVLLNIIFSLLYQQWSFIINSILGLGIFFVIALIMFYSGQWGGGDSKMLMGIGALIGISYGAIINKDFGNLFLLSFFVNVLIAGAIYGLFFTFFLAFKHKKNFVKEYKKLAKNRIILNLKKALVAFMIICVAAVVIVHEYMMKMIIFSLFVVVVLSVYMWLFVKVVEKACMYKLVAPSKLTEGDWIAKDIMVDGKYIAGPKDLGIEKEQIKKLKQLYKKKKVGKILVKEGIPFVPSFLIAFIITYLFGNLVFLIF